MAGLVQRMLRDIIKSGKDGIVRSSPDISVLWAGSRDGRPVSTYGIFIGSDCICFGHRNEVKPYEIHIPSREKVKQYAPMVADILRAAGMLVEILENEIIVIDGMEIPWDGEKMTMYSGKVNIFIKKQHNQRALSYFTGLPCISRSMSLGSSPHGKLL